MLSKTERRKVMHERGRQFGPAELNYTKIFPGRGISSHLRLKMGDQPGAEVPSKIYSSKKQNMSVRIIC